jgi:predicted transcriptional regulator
MVNHSRYQVADVLKVAPAPLHTVEATGPLRASMEQLRSHEVACSVIVDESGSTKGVIGGYNVLLFVVAGPFDISTTINHVQTGMVTWHVFRVKSEQGLATVIEGMVDRKRGHVVVEDDMGKPIHVVGLLDILRFYDKSGAIDHVKSRTLRDMDLAARVEIAKDSTVSESAKLMINRHLRRLAVKGTGKVLSDRSIVNWLLEADVSRKMPDPSKDVLDSEVAELDKYLETPKPVNLDADLSKATRLLLESDARCLLVEGGEQIVTPLDLVLRINDLP